MAGWVTSTEGVAGPLGLNTASTLFISTATGAFGLNFHSSAMANADVILLEIFKMGKSTVGLTRTWYGYFAGVQDDPLKIMPGLESVGGISARLTCIAGSTTSTFPWSLDALST